ncbi:Uncharacterised protein [Candidatus Anstonella stagnisolia]|nr:Uncharacterised protein [Candidatus Anstonella stagnisolia]
MNLTVRFEGHVEDVIERLVKLGIASTKSEALRLGVLRLEQEYLRGGEQEALFDAWAQKEAQRQDELIGRGKMTVYSQKEFEKRVGKKK